MSKWSVKGDVVGPALMLASALAIGVAMHQIVHTGNCSSTGYNQYGPVARCPGGEGAYIGLLMFGIFGGLIGAALASRLVAPLASAWLIAWGVGPLLVGFDTTTSSGKRTFGFIFGGLFTVLGLLAFRAVIRRSLRRAGTPAQSRSPHGPVAGAQPSPSPLGLPDAQPDAIMAAYTAKRSGGHKTHHPTTSHVGAPAEAPAAVSRAEVLEAVGKLAELHKTGALTDEEFSREKARLLAEL